MVGSRASGARGGTLLDLAAAAAGVGAMALGVIMSAVDWSRHVESTTALAAFGSTPAFDASYRLSFLPWALGLALVLGVLTAARWFTVRRDPFLRRHARRPLALLVLGATILDVAYAADASVAATLPHAARAVAIDPAYVVGGFFVVGAAWRLCSLARPLPPTDPEVIL